MDALVYLVLSVGYAALAFAHFRRCGHAHRPAER